MIRKPLGLAVAAAVLVSGCALTVAPRFQYACSLNDEQLRQYSVWFSTAFPGYVFDSYLHNCGEGLAPAVLLRTTAAKPPSRRVVENGGCVRYDDPNGIDDLSYTCSDGVLKMEVSFEDDAAYVYPLAP